MNLNLIPAREADRWIPEFEATLIYRLNSRTAQATQRKPVSKTKNNLKN